MSKNSENKYCLLPNNKKLLIVVVFAIVLLGVIIVGVGRRVWMARELSNIIENTKMVFSSQEECEQNTGFVCSYQMCDYIPSGKTYEEVCGKNFKKGWVATSRTITDSIEMNKCQTDSDCTTTNVLPYGCCRDCRTYPITKKEQAFQEEWSKNNCTPKAVSLCPMIRCLWKKKEAKCVDNKCSLKQEAGGSIGTAIDLCEEITIQESKDRCYYDFAQSRNNKGLCERIGQFNLKNECAGRIEEKNIAEKPVLGAIGSYPDAINIGESADILFSVTQAGAKEKASSMILEEVDESGNVLKELGRLNDEGKYGDLSQGDYIYSGTFEVGPREEGVLYFRVKAAYPSASDPVYTLINKFGITRFSLEGSPSDMSKIVKDPNTGDEMISNEVIISFKEGVSSERVEEIIRTINGTINSYNFSFNSFVVRIPDTKDVSGVNNAVRSLMNFPEVKYAEPNHVNSLD